MSLESEVVKAEVIFPALMESTATGAIILATGKGIGSNFSGFVVKGFGLNNIGDFSCTWRENDFKPFKGSVTLTDI